MRIVASRNRVDRRGKVVDNRTLEVLRLETFASPAAGGGAVIPKRATHTIVVTGGTLRPKQHSLVEPLAAPMLDSLRVDTVFIGCNGVDAEGGITNVNLPEAEVKQAMLLAARRRVIVADGSKVGEVELAKVCDIEEVSLLITDPTADPEVVAEIAAAGCRVELAG